MKSINVPNYFSRPFLQAAALVHHCQVLWCMRTSRGTRGCADAAEGADLLRSGRCWGFDALFGFLLVAHLLFFSFSSVSPSHRHVRQILLRRSECPVSLGGKLRLRRRPRSTLLLISCPTYCWGTPLVSFRPPIAAAAAAAAAATAAATAAVALGSAPVRGRAASRCVAVAAAAVPDARGAVRAAVFQQPFPPPRFPKGVPRKSLSCARRGLGSGELTALLCSVVVSRACSALSFDLGRSWSRAVFVAVVDGVFVVVVDGVFLFGQG